MKFAQEVSYIIHPYDFFFERKEKFCCVFRIFQKPLLSWSRWLILLLYSQHLYTLSQHNINQ